MKVRSLAAVILLAGTLAFAQKSDPLVKKYRDPLVTKPHTARTPLPKSVNADAAAAALKRKSSTASDLTKIEHSSMVHAGGKSTSAAKGARVPNNVPAYRNKPMHGSNSNRNVGKHIPTVRKATGKVG